MKMPRLWPGLAIALLSVTTASAQDAAPGEGKKGTGQAEKPKAASGDPLRQVLLDCVRAIKSIEEETAKENKSPFPSFELSRLGEPKAMTLRAIGTAQAQLGDLEAARKNWQSAADLAGEFSDPEEKVRFLVNVATAQNESGDHEEAIDTLQQAARSVRLIRNDLSLPGGMRLRLPFQEDPSQQKAGALRLTAAAQDAIGDHPAAKKTFAQALETAELIKDKIKKTYELTDIARAQRPEDAKATWDKAMLFANSLTDEFLKAKALELILRARAGAGEVEEVLKTLRDDLKGDLKSYLLWALADELAAGEPVPKPGAVAQLLTLAEKAEYDHSRKKSKVFSRISQLQAKVGDGDAAYRTLGVIQPDNAELRFSNLQAKVGLMRDVARAQLKAGAKDSAKDTLQVAMEIVDPYLADGASYWFPVAELAELLAESGDLNGALQTAEAIEHHAAKINVLTAVAVVQAKGGDRPGALATLTKAHNEVKLIPNETQWRTSDSSSRTEVLKQLRGRRGRRMSRELDIGLEYNTAHSALQVIATAQAKIGDIEGALKSVAEITDREKRSGLSESTTAYSNIAMAQVEARDFKGAIKTIELIPVQDSIFDDERMQVVEEVAAAQAKAGDAKGVLVWAVNQPSAQSKLIAIQGLAEGISELKQASKKPAPKADETKTPRK